MTTRRTRLVVWLIGAASAVIGGSSILVAVRAPLDLPAAVSHATSAHGDAHSTVQSMPPLATFEKLFSLRLQQPLFETTPVLAPQRTESPRAPLHLAGTIVEPGRSVALFQTASGKLEQRRVGERLDGAELLRVAPDHVEVMYRGEVMQLKVEEARVAVAETSPASMMEAFRSAAETTPKVAIVSQFQPPSALASAEVTYVLPVPDAATQPSAAPGRSE